MVCSISLLAAQVPARTDGAKALPPRPGAQLGAPGSPQGAREAGIHPGLGLVRDLSDFRQCTQVQSVLICILLPVYLPTMRSLTRDNRFETCQSLCPRRLFPSQVAPADPASPLPDILTRAGSPQPQPPPRPRPRPPQPPPASRAHPSSSAPRDRRPPRHAALGCGCGAADKASEPGSQSRLPRPPPFSSGWDLTDSGKSGRFGAAPSCLPRRAGRCSSLCGKSRVPPRHAGRCSFSCG